MSRMSSLNHATSAASAAPEGEANAAPESGQAEMTISGCRASTASAFGRFGSMRIEASSSRGAKATPATTAAAIAFAWR